MGSSKNTDSQAHLLGVVIGFRPVKTAPQPGSGAREPTIDGALIVPLRRIPDERGTILHMLKTTDEHFQQFGEIYFTTIYRNVVKGWHKHREMTLNYACVFGRIKLVLFDERDHSPTRGVLQEIFL